MNTDSDQLVAKKKQTGSIVCLVAAVLVLVSLFMPWLKSAKLGRDGEVTMSLRTFSICEGGRCESMSNMDLAKLMKEAKQSGTSFPYFGWATLIVGLVGVIALGVAGGMGLKGRFVREPIAITTVALVSLCLALVLGCIFVATKPGDGEYGRLLGVSWPFFVFGIGVVGGIAGAQMLAKAHAPPEYDPYADPTAPMA